MFQQSHFTILLLSLFVQAPSLFSISLDSIKSLGLPVITIETVDGEEPTCEYVNPPEGMAGYGTRNATKVPGRLTITLGEKVLYDSGPYEKNVGGMRIKIRGNSSAWPRKKPYKVKLEVGADLLLRGDEEKYANRDWLLLKDPELLQTIGFEASRLIGMEWTSGHRYVSLVMNGDYRGLYLLCEPVERNTRYRIDVSKTGYIVESDAYFWCEDLYIPSSLNPFGWTIKYPDADDVTEEQVSFLSREMAQLEESLVGPQYAERIDVESFARWLLTHDILGTWDSYGSNLFIARYDTLDSKVRMPVLWDFDTIFRMEGAWANIHRNASSSIICLPAKTTRSGGHTFGCGTRYIRRFSRECYPSSTDFRLRRRPRPSMRRCGWMQSGGTAVTPVWETIWTRQGPGSEAARHGWTKESPRR